MKYFLKSAEQFFLRLFRRNKKEPEGVSKERHITLVTQWYSPEPVSVPILTAKELIKAGFSVEVLTGIPNLPDGKVHAPYKAWKCYKETLEGIRVRRAPLYPNHSASPVKRMLNYISWSFSATLVGWKSLVNSDVNVVHCTPATTAIPALIARWISGTPYIVIIQDLWPDTVAASGFVGNRTVNNCITQALNVVVRVLYGHAAQIAVISDGMRQTLLERGFDAEKITRVFNSVDEDVFYPQEPKLGIRDQYGIPNDVFLLVYAGNQGSAQNLGPLLQVVAELKDQQVHLLMVGWGVEQEKLQQMAEESDSDNIYFIDRVPPREVRLIQSVADLSVVSLKDDPLFRITIPSKLQTLLASGEAILGVVAGDPGKIIAESQSGFVAEPGDISSIKNAILRAKTLSSEKLSNMGHFGRKYYLLQMSSKQRTQTLHGIVKKAWGEHQI